MSYALMVGILLGILLVVGIYVGYQYNLPEEVDKMLEKNNTCDTQNTSVAVCSISGGVA